MSVGIAEIEAAILARIGAAGEAGVLGYRVRTLETYPADFDLFLKEKIKGDRAFPAVWVVFGGWRNPVDAGQSLQAPAVFMVVVAAQNLRNETARRHGAGDGEVGSYQLMLDVAGLIHGQTLGLDIGRLALGPCRSVRPTATILERQLSLYALEFTTLLPIAVAGFPAGDLDDFSTFNVNWDVAPFGGVDGDAEAEGVQLPADETADATDRLELET
jgi:phage gp37-like protein